MVLSLSTKLVLLLCLATLPPSSLLPLLVLAALTWLPLPLPPLPATGGGDVTTVGGKEATAEAVSEEGADLERGRQIKGVTTSGME